MTLTATDALDGAALRLTLDNGKGNIVDSRVVAALSEALTEALLRPALKVVVLEAAGKDFSFGASVEEHRPAQCAEMLKALHGLVRQMVELPVPLVCAVKGRCLGGGLELALASSRIVAHPSAKLGNPEVKLAVFAPAASALMPLRVGPYAAEELLVTGRTVDAAEAKALRLVDEVCAEDVDPAEAALAWAKAHLVELSPSSLRFAVAAVRSAWADGALQQLDALERLYLSELMATHDAKEGIAAFLEKRKPTWQGLREA